MDTIKVGIRVRPLLKRELEKGYQWEMTSNSLVPKTGASNTPYCFDYVFGIDSKSDQIYYALVQPIVSSVMEGFNGTIFAYGQTSSGKTHTMMGDPHDAGVMPLSIAGMFEFIHNHPEREFMICASYMEIYNESLTDLLQPSNKKLKIQEDSQHNVKVLGITEEVVKTPEEIGTLLCFGQKNRSIGETQLNDTSSRSHTIFTLNVESRLKSTSEEEEGDGVVKVAALNLVDLAGSERVSATGTEGMRFKEGTYINRSLLNLGNVIAKLSEGGSSHIPFRDSKLTRILQSSLGGNAKTCIICTITPAELGESHSTLKFASRAMVIKNKPIINEVFVGEEALMRKLKEMQKENEKLKKKLEEGLPMHEQQQLTEQLAKVENDKIHLEQRLETYEKLMKSSAQPQTEVKRPQNRRKTVCCAGLSSCIESTPVVRVTKKVTFASPELSPFVPRFDLSTFNKHLQNVQNYLSPSHGQSYPKVPVLRGRASFIPTMMSTPIVDFLEDSNESDGHSNVDVQIQADGTTNLGSSFVGTKEAQGPHVTSTDVRADSVPTDTSPSPCRCQNPNQSFCVHMKQSAETIRIMQFEVDEAGIQVEELQHQLEDALKEKSSLQARADSLQKQCKDMEMAGQAQEELLLELQGRLKEANQKVHERVSFEALEKERMATIRQLEQTGKELSEELNRTKMELHERRETVLHGRREMKDSGIQISGEFMTTAVVELEHANRQIRDLNLEKEKLLREKDNAALDQEHFRMLMLELEETKAKLEEISLLKENLSSANDMIDFQASELERVKKELAEFTKGGDTPLGQAGENLADELGNALQKLPVLSLEDEIGQACESAKWIDDESQEKVEKLEKELQDIQVSYQKSLTEKKSLEEAFTQDLMKMKEELKTANEEKEVLRTKYEQAKDDLMSAEWNESESQEKLEKELQDIQVSHKKILTELTEKKSLEEAFTRDLMKMKEELKTASEEKEVLRTKYEQIKDDLMSAEWNENESQEKVEKLEKELQDIQVSHQKILTEKKSLEEVFTQDLMKMKEELKAANEEKENFKTKYEQAKDGLMSAEWNENEKSLEKVEKLEKELQDIQVSYQKILTELTEKKSLEEAFTQDLMKMKEELKTANEEKEVLKTKYEQAKDDLMSAEWNENESQEKVEKLEKELQDIQVSHKKILTELTEKKSLEEAFTQDLKEELKAANEEKEVLKTKYEQAKDDLMSAEWNENESQEKVEKLEKELQDIQVSHQKILTELTEKKSLEEQDLMKIKEELKVANEEKEVLKTKYEQAKDDLMSAEWNENESQEKVEKLEKELQDIQVSHKKILTELTEKKSLEEAFTQDLMKMKEELKTANEEKEVLRTKYEQAKDDLMSAEWNENESQEKMEKLEKELQDIQVSHKKILTEKKSLEEVFTQDLVKMKEELKAANEEKEVLRTKYEQAKDDLMSAEWNENESQEKVEKLEKELKDIQVSHQKILTELTEKDLSFEEASTQNLIKMKEELKAANEEKEVLRTKYEQAKDDLMSAEWNENESQEKVEKLEKELQDIQVSHQRIFTEKKSLEEAFTQDLMKMKEELKTANEEKEILKTAKDDLMQQLLKSSEELKNSTEELKDLRTRYEKTRDELMSAEWNEDEGYRKAEEMEAKYKELSTAHKLVVAQLKQTGPHTSQSKLMNENHELKETLSAVRRDNARLTTKIQGMAAVPKVTNSTVVDGSGTVTGLAFYKLKQELAVMSAEKEEQRVKMVKATERLARLTTESERIRKERNIFRAKYSSVKEVCTCGAAEKMKSSRLHIHDATEEKCSAVKSVASHSMKSPLSKSSMLASKTPLMDKISATMSEKHEESSISVPKPLSPSIFTYKTPSLANRSTAATGNQEPESTAKNSLQKPLPSKPSIFTYKIPSVNDKSTTANENQDPEESIISAQKKFLWEQTFLESGKARQSQDECKTQ